MIKTKTLVRNLTANWIGHGANLVVMFFLSPYILHSLGITEYGIWQLLTVLTGYMGILDLGVRAGTGRYIILYIGKKDHEKTDQTIRTGLGLYTCMGGLIMGAGILFGVFFPSLFKTIPPHYNKLILVLFPLLAVNVWISAVRTILSGILGAYERFDLARGSDLIMLFIRTLGTILALKTNTGLYGLTAAIIICNIAGLGINYYFSKKIHKGLRLLPLSLNGDRVKELYKYGIGAFLLAASAKILGQTDLVIAGIFVDVESVAVYSVGAMLIFYSNTFMEQINVTLFPSLQKSIAEDKNKETKDVVSRQIKISMVLGVLMYVGYFSYGREFIHLWMYHGDEFPQESVIKAAEIMSVLAVAKLLLITGSFSRNLLAANEKIGFAAKMTIGESIINLIVSIVLVVVFKKGLIGIALGTLFSHLVVQAFILPFHACRKSGISFAGVLKDAGFKGLLASIIFGISCFYLKKTFNTDTWILFFTQVGMAVLVYIPIAFTFLISSEDRKRFNDTVVKKFEKRKAVH